MNFSSNAVVHPTDTSIQSISVADASNSTYTSSNTPIVHIPPPVSGTQAKAHIELDSDGKISSTVIDEPGSGYDPTNPPTVHVINGYTPAVNLSVEQSIAKVHSSEVHTGKLYVSGELVAPSLTSNLTEIQGDITSLEGRVGDLETADGLYESTLNDHEARLGVAETLVGSHTSTLASHDSRISSAETQISLLGQASPFKTIVMPPEASVYADGASPAVVPSAKRSSSPQGWYFKNSGPPNKINWYLPPNVGMKYQDILSVKCGVFLMNKVSPPFFTIYTKPKASGNGASWYHSRHTYLIQNTSPLVNNTSYTFGFKLSDLGSEEPIYNSNFTSLTKDSFSSVGTISPTDEILFFAFSTDSSTAAGNAEFILHSIQVQTPTETTDFAFHSLTNSYQDGINTTQNTNIESLQTLSQSHTSTLSSHESRLTDTESITTKFSVVQNQLVPLRPFISDHLGFGSTDDYLKFTKDQDNSNQFLFGHKDDSMNASKQLVVRMPIQTNRGLLVADGNGNNSHTISGDFDGSFKIDNRAVLNELDEHENRIATAESTITTQDGRLTDVEQKFNNVTKNQYGQLQFENVTKLSTFTMGQTPGLEDSQYQFQLFTENQGKRLEISSYGPNGSEDLSYTTRFKQNLQVDGAISYQGETLRKKKYFQFDTTCINATGFVQSFTLPEPLSIGSDTPHASCSSASNSGYFPLSCSISFSEPNTVSGFSVYAFGNNTNAASLMVALEY